MSQPPNPGQDDPVALIERLDADAIRKRLDAIDQERRALLVLLRAALRRRKVGGEAMPCPR